MSAILVKTAKATKSFVDGHGRKRVVVDATPFRTDAATAAGLLGRGGFKLARDHAVPSAPLADRGAAVGKRPRADVPSGAGDLPGQADDAGEPADPDAVAEPSDVDA